MSGVQFSPGGKQLASASRDRTIRIWDVQAAKCTATLAGHDDRVSDAIFLDETRLASSAMDNTVKLWDLGTGRVIETLPHEFTMCLAVSPDRKRLASGSYGEQIRLWDLSGGR